MWDEQRPMDIAKMHAVWQAVENPSGVQGKHKLFDENLAYFTSFSANDYVCYDGMMSKDTADGNVGLGIVCSVEPNGWIVECS